VHRIISGDPWDGFITKGDANPDLDPGRVALSEIAGIVPSWDGGTLRIPRIGLLNVGQSSLSTSLLIGTIVVSVVFLVGSQFRMGTPAQSRRQKAKFARSQWAALYTVLTVLIFSVIIVPTILLSSGSILEYQAVTEMQGNVKVRGRFLVGQVHSDTRLIENAGWIPLTMMLTSTDERVKLSTPNYLLAPYSSADVELQVSSLVPDQITTQVRQSVYLPLLPTPWLQVLDRIHPWLAAMATALIPTLVMAWVGITDRRVELTLREFRLAAATRRPL
jgi:hypothetical protein